jgi:hypothetical protein
MCLSLLHHQRNSATLELAGGTAVAHSPHEKPTSPNLQRDSARRPLSSEAQA